MYTDSIYNKVTAIFSCTLKHGHKEQYQECSASLENSLFGIFKNTKEQNVKPMKSGTETRSNVQTKLELQQKIIIIKIVMQRCILNLFKRLQKRNNT